MTRRLGAVAVGVVLGALGVWTTVRGASGSAARPEKDQARQMKACADMRALATAIEAYALDNNFYPSSGLELIRSSALEDILVPSYVRAIVDIDPWGNEFFYWSDRQDYLLIDTAGDGRLDRKYAERLDNRMERKVVLRSLCADADPSPGADILFTAGEFCRLPGVVAEGHVDESFSEADRQKLTMKNIRTVAIGIEEYAIDNNIYPVLSRGSTVVGSLKPLLEPAYVKSLPTIDGRGREMLYWSNGNAYVIQSLVAGQDAGKMLEKSKSFDQVQREICKGATDDPMPDIVFINGQFCTWPAGIME